jgi:S1-C subfamily serine protease
MAGDIRVLALTAAAISLAVSSGPAFAIAVPSPYSASFETVPQFICTDHKAAHLGSGFRISDDIIVTATHVTAASTCQAYGKDVTVVRNEPGHDVTFVRAKLDDGFRAVVSCEGIREGERYLALGYADGGAPNAEPLIGTRDKDGNLTTMTGHVYPGMSGGAVLNERGAVVAVINAMNRKGRALAYVTPLSQTYLCKGIV